MQYIHKVRKDENLQDICNKYNTLASDVLMQNNIDESNIKEGLLLFIDIPNGTRYIVKPFDNLSKIALKFGKTEEDIKNFNNIKQVFLGQIIYIPD